MSWRDAARKYFPGHAPVPNVPNRPMGEGDAAIGTFGLFGTRDDAEKCGQHDNHVSDWMDREERAAIVELDGWRSRCEEEKFAGLRPVSDANRRSHSSSGKD